MTGEGFIALVALPAVAVDRLEQMARYAMRACSLTQAYAGSRSILLTTGKTPVIVPPTPGAAIVGRLFDRKISTRVTSLASADIASMQRSRGATLFDTFWGNYVALIEDPGGNEVHVLRDPMSGARCFHAIRDGIVAIASEPRLLTVVGAAPGTIDWAGLTQHLLADQLQTERTALTGIDELLAGARLTIGRERHTTMLWSPWAHAGRAEHFRDEREAARALREVTLACMSAWAGSAGRILANVSGGLDSSIVAAGLAAASADFTCLTLVTADPSGDERDYARLLAAHVGAPLAEHMQQVSEVDLARSAGARFARPVARSFAQAGDAATIAQAETDGAETLFNGGGGDNIFCYLQSASPLADRLLVEGPGRGAWATLADIGTIADASLWAVARGAVRRLPKSRRRYKWKADSAFLAPDAMPAAGFSCSHPWLDGPAGALPGKAAHIALLLRVQNHLQTVRGLMMPTISPLLSQPIVELCLRIPSWMWCGGGRNRHIARVAFVDALPAALIDRRSKGTPDSFVAALFEANRRWTGEALMEGALARHGLLDRAAVAKSLAGNVLVRGHDYWRLMRLVDAETWAQSWGGR